MTSAEIIQRHIHAGITQAFQRLDQRAAQAAHHHRFRHFHHQRMRRHTVAGQFIQDRDGSGRALQLAANEIDRHGQIPAVAPQPAQLFQCRFQHMGLQLGQQR